MKKIRILSWITDDKITNDEIEKLPKIMEVPEIAPSLIKDYIYDEVGVPVREWEYAQKRVVSFNASCIATYKGQLAVPETIGKEDLLRYILEHLDEVPATELEYLSDTDEPVTLEDIQNWDIFDNKGVA